ncbi:MAG: DUF4190 domain-containing protein [Microbacterium sp.]
MSYQPPQPDAYPVSPGYGAPYAPPRTNGLAIASFITGLVGLAIIPVVLGHISLSQLKRSGEGGKVFAVIGLVLGYLACLGYLVLFLVVAIGIGFAVSSS